MRSVETASTEPSGTRCSAMQYRPVLVLLRTVNWTRAEKKPPGVHTQGALIAMPEPTISTSPAVHGSVLRSLAYAAPALSVRNATAPKNARRSPRSEEHTSELQSH